MQSEPMAHPRPSPSHDSESEGRAITLADESISAQVRALDDLDWVLDELARRDPHLAGPILDIGCGMGALTTHIAGRLKITEMIGVDLDAERLKGAAARNIRPLLIDVNEEPLPVADGSVGLVACFGLLAYLPLFDNVLAEASRITRPGGWMLMSMPNLASYSNRLLLLCGYQPHTVAVSKHRQAGTWGGRRAGISGNMPPLLHGASLRCMRELYDHYGFDTVVVRGFAPGPNRRPVLDDLFARFPSLSRRFLILARRRTGA